MLIYADPGDLTEWTGTPAPENAVSLLRSASLLVRDNTVADVYDVDIEGYPTDAKLRTALRQATCAQAERWAALGIDPVKGPAGDPGVVVAKSVGSASIQRTVYASTTEEKAKAAGLLCPDAVRILRDAGLMTTEPWQYG